jgi:hypothetical protein
MWLKMSPYDTFLMLNPNPKTQLTSQQLVQILYYKNLVYFNNIKRYICYKYSKGSMWQNYNLLLYSIFRLNSEFSMPAPESVFI